MLESLIKRFQTQPDVHQNKRYAKSMEEIGWTILGDPGSYLYIRHLGPLGIGKIQRPTTLNLNWLNKIRRDYHLLTTYVEPGLNNSPLNSGIKTEPFAHSATSLVDLELTQDALLSSFKQKTRYNINLGLRKKNINIITKDFADLTENDLATFKNSRESWSKRKGVIGYEEKFIKALLKNFTHSGWIHFAHHQDLCVGTLMILKNNKSAIYYSAFVEPVGNKLFAPTLLAWTAMTTANDSGCSIFDFGGIYDERYKKMYKKWQGFTKFKDGFNPTVIKYPETRLLLGW